jgi:Flp pilus assembly protein TadD
MPKYLLQNPDDSRARLIYASKLGRAGRKEDAIREGTKALTFAPGDPHMLYNAACMYAALGESSRAIDTLRQAVEAGYTNVGWMQNDPDLIPLRDDPAYVDLLRVMRSRPAAAPAE